MSVKFKEVQPKLTFCHVFTQKQNRTDIIIANAPDNFRQLSPNPS